MPSYPPPTRDCAGGGPPCLTSWGISRLYLHVNPTYSDPARARHTQLDDVCRCSAVASAYDCLCGRVRVFLQVSSATWLHGNHGIEAPDVASVGVCARASACMCDLRLSSARCYALENSIEKCVSRALATRCLERASVLARRSKKTALQRLE